MKRIPTPFRSKYINETGVLIESGEYDDGSTALILKSALGEQLSIPTVNLNMYGEKPSEGNVFIKDYSENEGIFAELHRLGVVGNAVRIIEVGPYRSNVYECPLLKEI